MKCTGVLQGHGIGLKEAQGEAITDKRRTKEKVEDSYVVSFDVEPYHQGTRHHWTICRSQNPDELVSWGHAPTRELAQTAADKELEDLSAGRTEGGQSAAVKPYTHRVANRNY